MSGSNNSNSCSLGEKDRQRRLVHDMAQQCLEFLDSLDHDEVERDTEHDVEDQLKGFEADADDEADYATLCRLVDETIHFPTSSTERFLKRKYQLELKRGDSALAGLSLLNAQALAFRHKALLQHGRRIRRREAADEAAKKKGTSDGESDLFVEDESGEDEEGGPPTDERLEEVQKRLLTFQRLSSSSSLIDTQSSRLPPNWRIVQLSVEPLLQGFGGRFKKELANEAVREANFPLAIVSVSCGELRAGKQRVDVTRVPALQRHDRTTILQEFMDICVTHRQIYQKTKNFDKVKYNSLRDELDDRMESLLCTVEDRWLDYAKVLLLGRPRDEARVAKVEQTVAKFKLDPKHSEFLFSVVDGAHLLSTEQKTRAFQSVSKSKAKIKDMCQLTLAFVKANNADGAKESGPIERNPVVLILDKEIQCLPWESLSVLRKQPCSRVPSIFFLFALHETHEKSKSSVAKEGVKKQNVFYILNPNKDLQKTEDRLADPLKKLGDGFVGQWPSNPAMQSALSHKDAFMYCGHGGRMKTISGQEIEKLSVRAVPLLFGCNSGRLESLGRPFDPCGTASSYLIATAPSLLGFLWSVTDLDLDTWTVGFLDHWLGGHERDFVRAVAQRRSDFSRKMNGAAMVVYGLPSFLE